MHDNCDPNGCPVLPRVEALEKANEQHSATHREIFGRLGSLETENAVQNAHWENVDGKLDSLTAMVQKLTDKISEVENKPAKRWDKAVETVLVAIVTGVVCFLLGRLGL